MQLRRSSLTLRCGTGDGHGRLCPRKIANWILNWSRYSHVSTGKTHTIPPDLAVPFGTWPAGIVSFSVCLFLPIHTLANSVILAATVIIKKAWKRGKRESTITIAQLQQFVRLPYFSFFLLHLWPFLNFFSFLIFSFFDSNQVTVRHLSCHFTWLVLAAEGNPVGLWKTLDYMQEFIKHSRQVTFSFNLLMLILCHIDVLKRFFVEILWSINLSCLRKEIRSAFCPSPHQFGDLQSPGESKFSELALFGADICSKC